MTQVEKIRRRWREYREREAARYARHRREAEARENWEEADSYARLASLYMQGED